MILGILSPVVTPQTTIRLARPGLTARPLPCRADLLRILPTTNTQTRPHYPLNPLSATHPSLMPSFHAGDLLRYPIWG